MAIHAANVLACFPSFLRATEPAKLLAQVAGACAEPIETCDAQLFRIQRAHRLLVAESHLDMMRLAAALNLGLAFFDDLTGRRDLTYQQILDALKTRVQRIARIHLAGLGTPRSMLEGTAALIDADIELDASGRDIRHFDEAGTIHVVAVQFATHFKRPADRIHLYENPLVRQSSVRDLHWFDMNLKIENRDWMTSELRFTIQGRGDRTVRPMLYCHDLKRGLLFDGVIPDGKDLIVDADGPRIDGNPVGRFVHWFDGDVYDGRTVGHVQTVRETEAAPHPFDGDSPESLINDDVPVARPLRLPPGRSSWLARTPIATYDDSSWNYATWFVEPLPISVFDNGFQFDACVFDYEPFAALAFRWDEHMPCAVKVTAPAAAGSGSEGDASRLARLLPRFKPAGVRLFVDEAKPSWILGRSILRDVSAADGAGIETDPVITRRPNADAYVSADTPSAN